MCLSLHCACLLFVCLILWTQHGINHLVLSQVKSSINHLWLKKYHSQMFPTDLMWSKTHKKRNVANNKGLFLFFFWLLFLWFYGRDLLAIYQMDFRSTLSFLQFYGTDFLSKNKKKIKTYNKNSKRDKNVPRKKLMK